MFELGPLRMSYYVERNTVMTQRIFSLIKELINLATKLKNQQKDLNLKNS